MDLETSVQLDWSNGTEAASYQTPAVGLFRKPRRTGVGSLTLAPVVVESKRRPLGSLRALVRVRASLRFATIFGSR